MASCNGRAEIVLIANELIFVLLQLIQRLGFFSIKSTIVVFARWANMVLDHMVKTQMKYKNI